MLQEEQQQSNHIKLDKNPRKREVEEEKMSPEDPEMAEAPPVRGDSRAISKVIVIGSAH